MNTLRLDLSASIALSIAIHLLVVALVSFSWSSDPELERPPEIPSFVQAYVLEQEPAPAPRPAPAARPRPQPQPRPQPAPPRPAPEPVVERPAPQEVTPPTPSFSEPDLSELLAMEEVDLSAEPEVEQPAVQDPGTEQTNDETAQQVASYQQAIQQAITNRWLIPATARDKDDLVARVRVHLLPGGEVVDVALVSSSGDRAFDESVQSAIRSVGTLPVPSGELFHQNFRVMTIEFNPRMKSQ